MFRIISIYLFIKDRKVTIHHIRGIFTLLLITFVTLLFFGKAEMVFAKEPDLPNLGDCVPLDIIFLLDQAEDMIELDPEGARFSVPNWIVGFLGYDYLTLCPNDYHRIAVISFGAKTERKGNIYPGVTRVDLPFTSINPEQFFGADGWINMREEIFPSFNVESDMGARDFLGGLETAAELFRNNDIGRKQVLIMYVGNGGIPCFSDGTYGCYQSYYTKGSDSDFFTGGTSYSGLVDVINNNFSFDVETGPYIYIYSIVKKSNGEPNFSDQPKAINQSNYEEKIVVPWQKALGAHGEFKPVDSHLELARTMMTDILNLSPHPAIEKIDVADYYVDPFMANAYLFGYRSDPDSVLKLEWINYDPELDNAVLVEGQGDRIIFGVEDPLEGALSSNSIFYAFTAPPAGKWKIYGSQYDLWGFSIPSKDIVVTSPESYLGQFNEPDQIFDPSYPNFLKFKVVTAPGGTYLTQFNGYPAIIKGLVVLPNDNEYELTFSVDDSNQVFSSNEPLPVPLVGEYQWSITFSYEDASPKSTEIHELFTSTGIYQVNEVTPFTFKFDSPGEDILPLHRTPTIVDPMRFREREYIEVGVSLIDSGENEDLLPLDTVFLTDIDDSVVLIVTDVTADKTLEYPLRSVNYSDSYLVAIIPPEDFESEGEYLLEVKFVGVPDTQNFRESPRSVNHRIVRQDTLLTSPRLYWSILSIFALIILTLVLWFFYAHTNPIKGSLYFFRPGSANPFEEINLEKFHLLGFLGWRRLVIKRKRLHNNFSNIITSFINGLHIKSGKGGTVKVHLVKNSFEPEDDDVFMVFKDNDEKYTDHGISVRYSRHHQIVNSQTVTESILPDSQMTS
jgi:hypothetical protein